MTREHPKTGKPEYGVFVLYISFSKMNCALKPLDAKYEIIKFITDEVPQPVEHSESI